MDGQMTARERAHYALDRAFDEADADAVVVVALGNPDHAEVEAGWLAGLLKNGVGIRRGIRVAIAHSGVETEGEGQ